MCYNDSRGLVMSIFNNADPWQIKRFLQQIKTYIKSGQYVLVPRNKNLNFIKQNGISISHVEHTIISLTVKDYVKGPDPDKNHIGEFVWVFRVDAFDTDVYIKLQLRDNSGWVISFHQSEEECL
jgi:transposase